MARTPQTITVKVNAEGLAALKAARALVGRTSGIVRQGDDGYLHCLYCGAEADVEHTAYPRVATGYHCDHAPDCVLERARAALKLLDEDV